MSESALFEKTAQLAISFLKRLPEAPVAPTASRQSLHASLGGELPETGVDPQAVIEDLDRHARDGLMANAGPRFFGFVIGGALPVAVAAEWLAAAWDQNPGIYVLSPAEAVAEEVVATWVLDLLGLPKESSIGFVTGGQMANFTGLAAARFEVLRRAGWDVNEKGLYAAPKVHVVVGEEVHITILRALRYLGMGTESVVTVATDDRGSMRADSLRDVLAGISGPTIVCAQAGNVNTGAVDPLDEIADAASRANAWLHIDGAFGLWAAVSPSRRHLVRGAERADSWATDAHKWLNVPQDSGFAIIRHPAAHRAAVSTTAEYLIKSTGDERDSVDWVPEFSRRARGFAVYAALRSLGKRGVQELVDRCCDMAARMVERLEGSPNVEVLSGAMLNQALVRFVPRSGDADEFTRRVILRIQNEGTCWFGGTTWQGKAAMRISVSNWSTDEAAIDRSADAVLRCLQDELA